MPSDSATDLTLLRSVCAALCSLPEGPRPAAVYLCGPGAPDTFTDEPAYPYASVTPESRTGEPGALERAVRVRLVVRLAPGDEDPAQGPAGGAWLEVGAPDALDALADACEDALRAAQLGSRLASIAREYPDAYETPVQTVDLVLALSDARAYGDAATF